MPEFHKRDVRLCFRANIGFRFKLMEGSHNVVQHVVVMAEIGVYVYRICV